jgi:hypothetical protein
LAVVDAGVVHQPVDGAAAGHRLRDGLAACPLVGHFQLEEAETRLQGTQLLLERGIQRLSIQHHRHRRFASQLPADGGADAGASAGDDDDLVLQMQIHRLLTPRGPGAPARRQSTWNTHSIEAQCSPGARLGNGRWQGLQKVHQRRVSGSAAIAAMSAS